MPKADVWFKELDKETAERMIEGCAYVISLDHYKNYVKIGDCQGNLRQRLREIRSGLRDAEWYNDITVVAAWKFERRGQALDVVNETRRIASRQNKPIWLEIERSHKKPDFLYREGLNPTTVARWMERAIKNLGLNAERIAV